VADNTQLNSGSGGDIIAAELCRGWGPWRHRCQEQRPASAPYLCTTANDYGSTPRPSGCAGLRAAGVAYDTDDDSTDAARKAQLQLERAIGE
jgi:hypothetical protein